MLNGDRRAFCLLLVMQMVAVTVMFYAYRIRHYTQPVCQCDQRSIQPVSAPVPSKNHSCHLVMRRSDRHDPQVYFTPRQHPLRVETFQFVYLPQQSLCSTDLDLVVLIVSSPDRYHNRHAIRNTWGSISRGKPWPGAHVQSKVAVVFVMGRPITAAMTSEAETHGDVLLLNGDDTYRNLSRKVLGGLKWASLHCSRTKLIAKVDDDVFMNVDFTLTMINRWLSHSGSPNSIYGRLICPGDSEVNRNERNRLFVSVSQYPFTFYPSFVRGGCYVLPGHLVPRLVNASTYLPLLPPEDVFITGVLSRVLDVQLVSLPLVEVKSQHRSAAKILSSCYLAAHGVSNRTLYDIWQTLQSRTFECSKILGQPLKTCSQKCNVDDKILVH